MKFGHHVTCVASKAVEKSAAIARLMPNIGGPDSQKRLLLYGVAQSTMSYAAELWADIVSVAKYRTILEGAQRKALLRVAAAYRTVSSEALQVITGTPPIDITLQLRREAHKMVRNDQGHLDKENNKRHSGLDTVQAQTDGFLPNPVSQRARSFPDIHKATWKD